MSYSVMTHVESPYFSHLWNDDLLLLRSYELVIVVPCLERLYCIIYGIGIPVGNIIRF